MATLRGHKGDSQECIPTMKQAREDGGRGKSSLHLVEQKQSKTESKIKILILFAEHNLKLKHKSVSSAITRNPGGRWREDWPLALLRAQGKQKPLCKPWPFL